MWRFFLSVFIFVVIVQNFPAVSKAIHEITQDLAGQFNISTSPSLKKTVEPRDLCDRKLVEDNKRYYQSASLQKMAIDGIKPFLSAFEKNFTHENRKKENVVNYVNPEALNNPYGIHGNNYSLYDVNNPSGSLSKL